MHLYFGWSTEFIRTQVVIKIIVFTATFEHLNILSLNFHRSQIFSYCIRFSQINLYILMHSKHRLMSLQIFNQMKESSRKMNTSASGATILC